MGERQFGPYRLVQQIAVGGMAEIHLARTGGIAGFEKYVALKMIHPNFSEDEQFIQMLIDEAKITVQLQHVNIAQTFDLGRVGDMYYITMEYVDGCDLYALLRRASEQDRELPHDIAAFIAKEVATGLDYAHRKRDHSGLPLGIVHRDVSPQNVLISHAGEVKLVDFGIAKATMRARQTAVGVIKGKYYYMSPEQAWGDNLDHRSDVFSAGILLYEMLTGQMLYLEEDVNRLLGIVRRADIAPPTTLRRDIPPQLERIAMHALQKNADDRYRTAADLASDLERFLHVYSPVFSASKLAKFTNEILDVEMTPPPPEPVQQAPEMRSARRITQRVDQRAVVRSREEFTDENSVIFNVADMTARRREGSVRDAEVHTRQVSSDDFADDKTIIDMGPPAFDPNRDPAESHAPETLLDGDTTDVKHQAVLDDSFDAPTMALDAPMGKQRKSDLDVLEAATVRRPHKMPLAPATDALAAKNPRPAVSAVRTPKRSRRTPARGMPAMPSRMPLPAEPPGGQSSVISSLISEAIESEPPTHRPAVRFVADDDEQPTLTTEPQPNSTSAQPPPLIAPRVSPVQPQGGPGIPFAGALRPPQVGPGEAPNVNITFEQRALQALEVDAIPDAYKVGRGGVPGWVWRAALVAVCVAVGIAIGLMFLGDEDAPAPPASMEIVTIPPGAVITINGERQPGVSPVMLNNVDRGAQYRVVAELAGYHTWQQRKEIPLTGANRVEVIASLRAVTVTLRVESTPADAEVFLNGVSVGRTPLTLTSLNPDAARFIELRAPKHRPQRRSLDWQDKTEQLQQFTLEK